MKLKTVFKSLCLPSKVYLILSFVAILLTILAPALFGGISLLVHFIHIVYVLFWTWILQLICRAGYKWVSWVLVLAPFVLAFLFLVLAANGVYSVEEDVAVVPVVVVN